MPVRKHGRYVETTPEELSNWLGKESGKPVHVATNDIDLTAELKRGLSFVRSEQESRKEGVKEGQRPIESSSTALQPIRPPIFHRSVQVCLPSTQPRVRLSAFPTSHRRATATARHKVGLT
jgi:hypothetical protein